jgi:putative endonuclease
MKAREQNFNKGRSGEETARNYLESKGFEWVESNYANDIGEIDLIMIDKKWLVFVEVKYKTDDKFGIPEEMIGKNKLAKIKRVAEIYLMLNPKMRRRYVQQRIDAVCILGEEIRYYPNI